MFPNAYTITAGGGEDDILSLLPMDIVQYKPDLLSLPF